MGYENGKIYSIKSKKTEDIYIGSTILTLKERFNHHKYSYKYYQNGKGCYKSSYEIVKYDDAYIELLEDYPCESKKELCKKEGEYIRNNKCINRNIAGRTQKELDKEYYEKHKERIKKRKKEYYEKHKEKRNEYDKEYRTKNKEKIKKQKKEWYEKNKERINKKRREKIKQKNHNPLPEC